MVFELLLVFYGRAGKDLGCPIHRFLADLFVLRQARMRPVFRFGGSFMFFGASFDGSTGFTDIDGVGAAFAVELINAFAFARRTSFIFSAEHVLEFVPSLMEKVAACLGKRPLELVRDTGYETKSGIWTDVVVVVVYDLGCKWLQFSNIVFHAIL